jgi:DNA-directed RNA polymerase subunit beta
MANVIVENKWVRKSFGRIPEVIPMPNLIEVQKNSYAHFLQYNNESDKRNNVGLQEVISSVFPIIDYSGRAQLEFVRYQFDDPKYDVEECHQRGVTYAAPLKMTLRLVVWDIDEDTGAKSIRDIKEQDVYMGDVPLMTKEGTFVVNGTERVIVSQMHRSPGVFFDHDKGRTHSSGKFLYAARVIPYRGSWLDFEFDAKDILNVRIDRRRKIPATTILRALDSSDTENIRAKCKADGTEINQDNVLGMSEEEILEIFYDKITYYYKKKQWIVDFDTKVLRGQKLTDDLVDANTGEVLLEKGSKVTPRIAKKLQKEGLNQRVAFKDELIGRFLAVDFINEKTGEILAEAGDEVTKELVIKLIDAGFTEIQTLAIDNVNVGPYLRNTLKVDKADDREQALIEIYRVMRPGEPPTVEAGEELFRSLFFQEDRYDLSAVGRVKMNARLALDLPDTQRVLTKKDIVSIVRILLELKDGKGDVDDIDHLGNRRVRSVGELLENQYRIGLLRMERAIKERMSSVDIDTVMPHDLINAKPIVAVMREFFGSSQLSQFMDQTNPLSEITHKRRLSALGPGGLTRERASFEVRDVHPTHYGRICPIETPEGPNVGLINSLATYARVNKYGFIESPYRKVLDAKVTDEVVYLSAIEEGNYTIAQANAKLDKNNKFQDDFINCRSNGDYILARAQDINYIDVSPKQIVSVAASLIPFLENDDANRALMGSNMQRQAVPLMNPQAPLVGTGMESKVARDSGVVLVAKRDGVIDQVDANRIVIRANDDESIDDTGVDIYTLSKYQRSNHNTCINQRPLVKVGQMVKSGEIIADGPATDRGELALGRNVRVAFMTWNGYNFEDSILLSERVTQNDVFTSIHLEEFEIMARDTKLGEEEITRDIPNVGDEALINLDEAGIVNIGSDVASGDILIGKVTPKGEAPMTPEEKLLRAIFGEKAADVRDSSLRVPPGVKGTVVEVRVFSRRGIEKDERALAIERSEIDKLAKDKDDEVAILERNTKKRLETMLLDQHAKKGPKGFKAAKLTSAVLKEYSFRQWRQFILKDDDLMDKIEAVLSNFDERVGHLEDKFENRVEKLQRGDDLPPGVLKMIKVFVAVKRKIQPGDKMAGRHGNKGVVSRINPIEDMPYMEDGTPIDVVLNPLGLPSRMNVGQILETHLGAAAAGLGKKIQNALDEFYENNDIKALKQEMQDVYGKKIFDKDIKSLPKDNLIEIGEYLSDGVPMATPVFDGAHQKNIIEQLESADLDGSGQMYLYDGQTGRRFDRSVTVGYIYVLKLHHLVDDKIHARSIGPYSLVTQQPLGGKAQFGGQRFGEMEMWALLAYGAAFTLQEMLTVKSDDVAGRTKVYESIVRGDHTLEAGIPESFNVLIKELRSLGLNVELMQEEVDN